MARTSVTIKDVAREARVSVATVSRALTGHENVAESVRQQVLATADRLRYQPHAAARSLSSRPGRTTCPRPFMCIPCARRSRKASSSTC